MLQSASAPVLPTASPSELEELGWKKLHDELEGIGLNAQGSTAELAERLAAARAGGVDRGTPAGEGDAPPLQTLVSPVPPIAETAAEEGPTESTESTPPSASPTPVQPSSAAEPPADGPMTGKEPAPEDPPADGPMTGEAPTPDEPPADGPMTGKPDEAPESSSDKQTVAALTPVERVLRDDLSRPRFSLTSRWASQGGPRAVPAFETTAEGVSPILAPAVVLALLAPDDESAAFWEKTAAGLAVSAASSPPTNGVLPALEAALPQKEYDGEDEEDEDRPPPEKDETPDAMRRKLVDALSDAPPALAALARAAYPEEGASRAEANASPAAAALAQKPALAP